MTNENYWQERQKKQKQVNRDKIALKVGKVVINGLKFLLFFGIIILLCSFDSILDLIIK